MSTTCPYCNKKISIKTKFRVFKGVRKGTITPIRRCPNCSNWMVKKTSYVILLDIIFISYIVLPFFRVISFFVSIFLFLLTVFFFIVFAPYQKYKKKIPNIDNVLFEGEGTNKDRSG